MQEISFEQRSDRYLHVNSCGVQHLDGTDAGSLRPGGRIDYHILYIAKGCCFLTTPQGQEVCAPAGSVVVYLPGERQEYQFRKEIESKSYYIHFSGRACEELMEEFGLIGQTVFTVGKSTTLTNLLDTLIDEFYLKRAFYQESCQALLLNILSLIARKIGEGADRSTPVKKKINEMCRYIYAHYAEELTVGALASMCHLSESRFSHVFKDLVGMSPAQYILSAKIEMAKEMLRLTDLSVLQVAERVGIPNQNYFSRIFKKYTGVSPSEFRKT